jgi:hypothetical protein
VWWYVLSCSIAAAVLAGCGGSQLPISAPGATPQSRAIATHAEHGGSWMVLEAEGDLLYAPGGCGGTCVVSYPGGQLVGTLPTRGLGVCSDNKGNIFISDDTKVVEYAHGGTTPIATLSLPGTTAVGCSVDPKTNNLAVVFVGPAANIAIFPNGEGSPILYNSHMESLYCGYDNDGNLFTDGYAGGGLEYGLAELPNGASDFFPLSISPYIGRPGQVQWDGTYMTYETTDTAEIKRLAISGSTVTVVGVTSLRKVNHGAGPSWIYGGSVIVPFPLHGDYNKTIGFWKYPKGGRATNIIKRFGDYKPGSIDFEGVTISVAPSR